MSTPKEIAEKILNCKTYNIPEMQNLARAYLELEKKLQVTNNNWPHENKLHDEISKLKKSREGLRAALGFYNKGKHWDIVPMLGERILDKGHAAREAIKADDELMKEGGE